MITRTPHLTDRVLPLALAFAMAGILGCSKPEKSMDMESKQGAVSAPGAMSHDMSQEKSHEMPGGHMGGPADSMLMVATEPAVVKAGESVKLKLMIHDAAGAMIRDFETVHEKKLHLIIVRDGLDQFAHIHPEIDPAGNITGTHTFPTAGKYRLYADHKPAGGKPATPIAEVTVAGTAPAKPELVANTPGRIKAEPLQADIAIGKGKMAGATLITFTLSDAAGKPIGDLQPYLGAMGHLVVLSSDGMQYVHSHPTEEKSAGGVVAFEAHFPAPGIYKGWGQFQRAGKVHDVPFVIKIE